MMIENRRGAVHSLEAFMATVIVFTALLCSTTIPRERDRTKEKPMDIVGIQALLTLDGNGTLGKLVENQSWDAIERSLRVVLPIGISFNFTVFDDEGAPVNNRPISNGELVGRTMASVEYLLAVESGNCPLYRLRLQLGG